MPDEYLNLTREEAEALGEDIPQQDWARRRGVPDAEAARGPGWAGLWILMLAVVLMLPSESKQKVSEQAQVSQTAHASSVAPKRSRIKITQGGVARRPEMPQEIQPPVEEWKTFTEIPPDNGGYQIFEQPDWHSRLLGSVHGAGILGRDTGTPCGVNLKTNIASYTWWETKGNGWRGFMCIEMPEWAKRRQ